MLRMKTAIVTGATGFVGLSLTERLLRGGYFVYALARPGSARIGRLPASDRLRVVALPVSAYESLPSRIGNADVFFHLLWDGIRGSHRDDAALQERNCAAAALCMSAASALGCKAFIATGSQAEYGAAAGVVEETNECAPVSEYGRAKQKTCEALSAMAEKNGVRFVWARLFSAYGPNDDPGTLMMTCLEKMRGDEPVQTRHSARMWDYLYVDDAADALARFADGDCPGGIYNLASGASRPLGEYLEEMKRVLGSQSAVLDGAASGEPSDGFSLSVRKIKDALHWSPPTSFEAGIRKTLRALP